jgi:small basic protein
MRCGAHALHHAFEEHTMARIGAFCITTWLAAAILYFGQHSVAMIALSGVVVFGGFDLLRP